DEVAPPTPKLAAQWLRRFRRNGSANFGIRLHVVTSETPILYHARRCHATTTLGGGSVSGLAVILDARNHAVESRLGASAPNRGIPFHGTFAGPRFRAVKPR